MVDTAMFPLPVTVPSAPDDSTIVRATNTTDTAQLWDQFSSFYNENKEAIEKCMKTDVRSIALDENVSDIDVQIDTFSEPTKVVLDGLGGLEKIHPIIEGAVSAFHIVISLELSRRHNDPKAIGIVLEMRNMMCAMFHCTLRGLKNRLRHLQHTNVQESDRDGEKSRLHRLIENITADIIQCASDLNYYLHQKFAYKSVRIIKANNFEQQFKMHVENFSMHRSRLQSTIAVYIAGGVDKANLTITEVSEKLHDVYSEKGYFHTLWRKLDTPREKEAFRFFDQNNGVENCISKDDLLARLLVITGDVFPRSENLAGLQTDERIKKSRKILTDELHQNFEGLLQQNTLRFEKLLTIQANNLYRAMAQLENQGSAQGTISKLDKLLEKTEGTRASPTAPSSQNHEGHQWRPTEAAHEDPSPTTSTNRQDGGFTGEAFPIDRMDVDESHSGTPWSQRRSDPRMKSGTRPGGGSQSSASMFTNARVTISGGTFVTVSHNYEAESSVFTRGPAFPMAILGLQAVSFATRSNYPHFDNQLGLPPVLAPPSTVDVALRFPSLFSEMKIMMAPLTLWFFLKMWIQRRASEHY
ncbi:hypothetical protein D9619_003610 [Psilocybe cf. subviscida]|uniref:Uncharacterized protein n=1 Tax=Psilocybe cf. subviscida TaxID=2480587 RepID=A0A8H5AXI2_9AGAR|nr:hypothetical protein D9619_003610 [Psilocybe cf. subviscida]